MTFSKTVNLGNSIIGVSILAMPYCFVRSGPILSIILLVISGLLTRLSCDLLLKSALISKRCSFELIVQDILGSFGRLLVEVGLIGFLLGTCVAYFIMIGDLAPRLLVDIFDLKYDKNLRAITIIVLSLFIVMPLSLLRRVDSLTSFSLISMVFYSCLVVKLMSETVDKFTLEEIKADNLDRIVYWDTSGLLTTFPIFSMAMSCQTSLFEVLDNSAVSIDTIGRDNNIIKKAIYMCSFVYIVVGLLGFMAFHDQTPSGNILLAFPASPTTTLTKVGFIISLLLSFPLCLFPCRTSVHSLLMGKFNRSPAFVMLNSESKSTTIGIDSGDKKAVSKGSKTTNCDTLRKNKLMCFEKENVDIKMTEFREQFIPARSAIDTDQTSIKNNHMRLNIMNEGHTYTSLLDYDDDSILNDVKDDGHSMIAPRLYISDWQFRILTAFLITTTIVLSLMFPNIEFILGIIGSTAGTSVCFVLPAYTFIKIGAHTGTELFLSRILLTVGLAMLIFCTYSTIHNANLQAPTT